MKRLKTIIALLVAAAVLFGTAACANENNDEWVVHIGTTGTTRPHTFIENDELNGYDIEVIRMAASRIPGMKLEFTYGTMTELQEALRTGRIDMIVNNVAKTPAREEEFIFADRGYVFVETFLVVHNDDARTSLDQFDGAVMGGLGPANFFYRWLDEYNTENNNLFSEIRIYENYQELFMDIDLGRIDGTLCDAPIVMFNAQALNLDIKCVGEILDSAYSFFMIRNDDQGRRLKGEIDRVMTDIVNDGSLLALSMEWFGEDMTREK